MPCRCKFKLEGFNNKQVFCGTGYCDCRKKNKACGPSCSCFGCDCHNRLGVQQEEDHEAPELTETIREPSAKRKREPSQLTQIEKKLDNLEKQFFELRRLLEANCFNLEMSSALSELDSDFV